MPVGVLRAGSLSGIPHDRRGMRRARLHSTGVVGAAPQGAAGSRIPDAHPPAPGRGCPPPGIPPRRPATAGSASGGHGPGCPGRRAQGRGRMSVIRRRRWGCARLRPACRVTPPSGWWARLVGSGWWGPGRVDGAALGGAGPRPRTGCGDVQRCANGRGAAGRRSGPVIPRRPRATAVSPRPTGIGTTRRPTICLDVPNALHGPQRRTARQRTGRQRTGRRDGRRLAMTGGAGK